MTDPSKIKPFRKVIVRACPDCKRKNLWEMEDGEWICHSCGYTEFLTGHEIIDVSVWDERHRADAEQENA